MTAVRSRPAWASRRELRNWAVSLAATAASAYALDAIAAAAGVALVASGVLGGLGHTPVLAFLVASYAVWGLGLRANLRANWALLASTGTSTNVLSKAAYDVIRRRTTGVRAPRLAAAAGYTATEVAKEVPYYAGAFGAAVFTDSITATEALVFLGGANLGAAVYEYGLARLTGAFLRRRGRYASFDRDWVPAPSPAPTSTSTTCGRPCSPETMASPRTTDSAVIGRPGTPGGDAAAS